MKSSDAIYYGRLLRTFTKDKDFTFPIYSHMQLLDIQEDIQQYEQDSRNNLPNMLFMKLSQKLKKRQIPLIKKDAIILANEIGATE
jgi:hypothetical protein